MFCRLARPVPLVLLFVCALSASAQTVRITGRVLDEGSGAPLQYANVVVKGANTGTTTDGDGRFILQLAPGQHTVLVSYLGYVTATRRLDVRPGGEDLVIRLRQESVRLPAVQVTPGENPALPIIRNAIAAKQRQRDSLQSYHFASHSKLNMQFSGLRGASARSDERSVTVGASVGGGARADTLARTVARPDTGAGVRDSLHSTADSSMQNDSTNRNLTVLLESQTDAYYDRELGYKEIVTARKQSSFLPAKNNFLIGAFFTADFSGEELKLDEEHSIPAPLTEAGLNRYYYRLDGQTVMDGQKIHIIHIEPYREGDPLMEGTLYIADSTFALRLADIHVTRRALPRFFDSLAFRQNFRMINDRWWMPADVAITAKAGLHLLIDIDVTIQGLSLLQDWQVNGRVDSSLFDRTMIKVLKEADLRDSSYWASHARLPNTIEEIRAYHEADSIKVVLDSTRNVYGLGNVFTGKTFTWDETKLIVPGLLTLYRYNRVEGSALNGDVVLGRPLEWMQYVDLGAGYGFMDKHPHIGLGLGIEPLRGVFSFQFGMYDDLKSRTEEYDQFGDWISTIGSIVDKSDYRSYYYLKGAMLRVNYDFLRLFPLSVALERAWNGTARTHATWSLFNTHEPFPENPPINDGWFTKVDASVGYDGRPFIDNAGELQRIGEQSLYPMLGIGRTIADLDNETVTATTYTASLRGKFDVDGLGLVRFDASANTTQGALTTQQLFTLYGTIQVLSGNDRFRTLGYSEFGGDRRAQFFLTVKSGDRLFRTLSVPWIRDAGVGLDVFGGAGWAWMNDHTRQLQLVDVKETRTPFLEAGFSIDNIFSLFRVDFAWRLNHFREHRNFYVGLDTALF